MNSPGEKDKCGERGKARHVSWQGVADNPLQLKTSRINIQPQ